MAPAHWDSPVNTQSPSFPKAPRNIWLWTWYLSHECQRRSDDLLDPYLIQLLLSIGLDYEDQFSAWLDVSAVIILIWDSLFKTVDAAALHIFPHPIYWSDPLKVHVIHKSGFVQGYHQVGSAPLKQEGIGNSDGCNDCVQEMWNKVMNTWY